MDERNKALLTEKINKARVVSFDIFDTLLFRKTNSPEAIFDLVGRHFGIHGFRKLRMREQDEASRRAHAAYGWPHADMDQIYEVLSEHTEIPVDWKAVKDYEIQMERDALVANEEMLEFFRYAREQGKRVVITSDMYLSARVLGEILEEKGFGGYDYLYCSADEHKAKFNREIFELLAEREAVPFKDILHIGDKARDDGEYPAAFGMDSFVYKRDVDLEKIKDALSSDVDKGLYKILYDRSKGFWYNLGIEVGGPLYMGLYRYVRSFAAEGRKIFFLSRDGYNLYHIFKEQGFENVEYLCTSRRALTLAAISEMNERDIDSLPPYTLGQTVGEILDYLCIDRSDIKHLGETGLGGFDSVIGSEEDQKAFRKLYTLDRDVFLNRCAVERKNALKYYEKIGFLGEDAICFDCGWQGSSQELLEQFKKAVGCTAKHHFIYFGIKNAEKSRRQLRGFHYDTYLFDFYKGYTIQTDVNQNVVMYELFFSAPHESVYCYDEEGEVLFEAGEGDREKAEMLKGICDYIRTGLDFVDKYDVEYTPDIAVGHLKRLIHLPTEEEAVMIGDLQNVDGFVRQRGEEKRIAYVTRAQLEANPNIEIYWMEGLLKRPDISEKLKKECAAAKGVAYPREIPQYHLEDGQMIRNYHRWLKHEEKQKRTPEKLDYKPRFSVVIPVYNTVTEQLEECFRSVLAQTYDNYELILVDDHSSWDNVRPVLRKFESNQKVKVIYRPTNGHISEATNDGIRIADGDFIVFMDCDDTIEPDALYEFAKKLNENPELDFIYSDEDKITEDGKIRHMVFFKPEWSPDLFLNMMYTNHLATYRASIVKAVGGLRTAYNGSQDYDFTLRFMEKSDNKRVGHVSKILYHWRERKESVAFSMSSKNYAAEAARYAKEDYIRRNSIPAHLEYIDGMSQYRMVYEVEGSPLVSIVIPSKDHPDILKQCIESIRAFTAYKNYEIVVVDNGSGEDNRLLIKNYLSKVKAKYIYGEMDFNFSKMCNMGAEKAEGEYLLFLNDDVEIFQPQWLERMLGHAQQRHSGAVGAKLFYPQSTRIQHTGVSNPRNGPLHSFMTLDDCVPYYFGWNWVDNNCIGVTGACLMLARTKFEEAGRFDENLPVAYNDVKLCFALHRLGYYNVIRNDVVAYHHESLSRGTDALDDEKLKRLGRERSQLFAEFPELKNRDPYMSENLGFLTGGHYCDDLAEMKLSLCIPARNAHIDSVSVTDRIRIQGWSIVAGVNNQEDLERYVVFADPFGKTYGVGVQAVPRPDVAIHLGNPGYLYSGFECELKKSDLRVDIMPYRVGVLTVTKKGLRYLRWCDETPVVREPAPRPIAAEHAMPGQFEFHGSKPLVNWSVDSCQHLDSYHCIKGFAFKRGKDHYCYRKSLMLVDRAGTALEFEVQLDERVDVACTFINEKFLYNTGFICYIFDEMLEKGQEYDLYIRLRNQFDAKDIHDIETGRKLIV